MKKVVGYTVFIFLWGLAVILFIVGLIFAARAEYMEAWAEYVKDAPPIVAAASFAGIICVFMVLLAIVVLLFLGPPELIEWVRKKCRARMLYANFEEPEKRTPTWP